jgi:hypothetical protein
MITLSIITFSGLNYIYLDAMWGNWGSWIECPSTCECESNRTREHLCDSPSMKFGGRNCTGLSTELYSCYDMAPCKTGK